MYGILAWGLAVLAWTRRRHVWALFPIVLLPFMAAHQVGRRDPRWFVTPAAAAVTWVGINLPVFLASPAGWEWFWRYNAVRSANTLWKLTAWSPRTSDPASAVIVAVGAGVLLVLVLTGRLDPIHAGAAALTWRMAWNKVYSPQYVLWVLYAVVIAGSSSATNLLLIAVGILSFLWTWATAANFGVHSAWNGAMSEV
jgi:hypothetical protein